MTNNIKITQSALNDMGDLSIAEQLKAVAETSSENEKVAIDSYRTLLTVVASNQHTAETLKDLNAVVRSLGYTTAELEYDLNVVKEYHRAKALTDRKQEIIDNRKCAIIANDDAQVKFRERMAIEQTKATKELRLAELAKELEIAQREHTELFNYTNLPKLIESNPRLFGNKVPQRYNPFDIKPISPVIHKQEEENDEPRKRQLKPWESLVCTL